MGAVRENAELKRNVVKPLTDREEKPHVELKTYAIDSYARHNRIQSTVPTRW